MPRVEAASSVVDSVQSLQARPVTAAGSVDAMSKSASPIFSASSAALTVARSVGRLIFWGKRSFAIVVGTASAGASPALPSPFSTAGTASDVTSMMSMPYVASRPGNRSRIVASTSRASSPRSDVSILYRRSGALPGIDTELTAASGSAATASRTAAMPSGWSGLNSTCTLVPPVKSMSKSPWPRCQAAARPARMKSTEPMIAGFIHLTN